MTANEYLARRDAELLGPVFARMGLTVGCLHEGLDDDDRRIAYDCDITYGTVSQFGFDFLRDRLKLGPLESEPGRTTHFASRQPGQVQRGHHFALIDEADSILIDEARTPVVIDGSESLDQLRQLALPPPEKVPSVASQLGDLFQEVASVAGVTRVSSPVFTGTAMPGMEISARQTGAVSVGTALEGHPTSGGSALEGRPTVFPGRGGEPSRQFQRWEVGVTVTERAERTLERTLSSLHAAGFPAPRIFADGPVAVPGEPPLTRRMPAVGGWPNFWLALTEMISRDPSAEAYLIVQDDVVFCRNLVPYLGRLQVPDDCGAISLFCPACYNGPFGWHPTEVGYGLAGAQALAFPRERAFEFLAHPWTVNHRRRCPRSEHYRGDGLHHIDGVVGEWCRRAKLRVYTHSPSLSQHIGSASVMYPNFQGKPHRRFADSFPGEDLDAMQVFPWFARNLRSWQACGGFAQWAVSGHLWAAIARHLRAGMRTWEAGSGLSTKLFLDAGCQHTSLEHDPVWADRICSAAPQCRESVRLCSLSGTPAWYDWEPDAPYDLVLIDGPPQQIGRAGVVRIIERLLHEDTVIFVDDATRPAERTLCEQIAAQLQWSAVYSTAGHHGYARIARRPE
jgi:hypothetical protein